MPRNTRNEEQICPYQPPNDAEKNQKAWGLTIHEQGTNRSSLYGHPRTESQQETLGKKCQKKKIMRNKEGTSYQSCWHNISSGTQESKGEELVVPWNPRMTL